MIVADTAQDFAMGIRTILTDSNMPQSMEEQARSFVRQRLSPKVVYEPLVERILEHVRGSFAQ